MRIGIVTDNYFPSVGGTEISIWNYTKRLEKAGHKVFVFCPSHGRKNPNKKRPSTVRLPSIRGIYPDHPLLFLYPGITKEFRKYKLDVLHSQTPVTAPYIAEYLSNRLCIPHIHTMHTLIPEQVRRMNGGLGKVLFLYVLQTLTLLGTKPPQNYLLQDEKQTLALKVRLSWRYILRLVSVPDHIIFPSKHVKDIFKARGFTNSSSTLPTFSDMFSGRNRSLTYSYSERKALRIIYVGRLDVEKRPQVVIDAVNLLPDDLDWKLIIIGDGNQRNKLKRLARRYKIHKQVEFKGRLKQSEIRKELRNADIFVMPSYRFDTQGIVLLEACGAGLPIVYCDDNLTVGVERQNSILAKPYAGGISEALWELLENNALRKRLARGSLAVGNKYMPKKLTSQLIEIYHAAIKVYNLRHKTKS